ncbi:39S ribosomal protein L40, mitochondrial-like [Orbicella faveolata]|uniref:39S ribosomal protein L40, mitochondrial-like n=1 Tax=Orbicella faveolata TaxID=48498 RepID=UPI0009E2532D|nr:39S ribosomal protein L40, mitochondrial-like [Orbicella faveolata]
MATYLQRRMLSVFVRFSGLSIRQSLPARHNPSLKRKKNLAVKKKKKTPSFNVRKTEIVPPIDPESLLNAALLEASRQRHPLEVSPEEQERRILLLKEWSRHKMQQHKEDLQRVQELERCREEALKELKKSSLHLYEQAIQVGGDLFPLQFKGPTETPPIADYMAPDMDDKVKGASKARR